MMKLVVVVLAVAAVAVSTASADGGLFQSPPFRPLAASDLGPMLEHDLGLGEAKAKVVAASLVKRRESAARAHDEVMAERDALADLVDGGAPDADVAKQVAVLRGAMARVPAPDALFDETRGDLTPTQQAKLFLRAPPLGGGPPPMHGRVPGGPGFDRRGCKDESDKALRE